jgi:peptide/nickel transport system ATP-binding protein
MRDERYAVREMSLSVGVGESVGLVGESGSGKSLTTKAILRLLPRGIEVGEGSVRFEDNDLLSLPEGEMRAMRGTGIGYVPQDPLAALNPLLPVGDQVTEGLRMHSARGSWRRVKEVLRGYGVPIARREASRRAAEILEQVGIDSPDQRARQYPGHLSGGMRQRAIIGAALALRPKLLVADEPTTALDATIEREILDLVSRLRREMNASLLLVSHDLDVIAWVCERAYVLYRGRVMEAGSVEELFSSPRHPYTRLLVDSAAAVKYGASRRNSAKQMSEEVSENGCPFAPRCANAIDKCWSSFPTREVTASGGEYWCFNPVESARDGAARDAT